MAIYKITQYSRETLCSLQFWWKRSTTLGNQSGSYCHQPRKLIPLTESTWSALKENGLLHILNKNIDICVFTEIWLKDCDTVSIAGLSPTGYEFRNFPRLSGRRGGGTGIVFKDSLNVKMSDGSEKQSFEFSEWTVCVHQYVIKVVSVYRPPHFIDHPISSRVFFEEFSTYLEDIVMAPGILLTAGDFAEILQSYGLQQHVQVPTHESGHTLDLIITRSNNDITVSSPKAALTLSDHFFIECNLNIPRPSSTVNEIFYRKLKTLGFDALKTDITESLLCTSTWKNVSELA